ncbi:MAG: GntR family transcriptional regulator [Pseudolysinimonas sp.]|uniref:GntR family transcriptional regulator n=1 Tax=Pseudolysinimonas sp. TaxID=2680009 RepID=UPI003C76A7EC
MSTAPGGVRRSPVPLYSQIEQHLRERIASGELPPQTQIDSETEIASSFSVSRMTARKAIESLVREGLLFRSQGKGTFVNDRRISYGLSTQLSFSASMEARGHRVETTVVDASLQRAPAGVAHAMNVEPGSPVVGVRRIRCIDGSPAALHESWLPASLISVLDTDLTGSLNAAMTSLGRSVTIARDHVEAVEATPDVASALECELGAAVLRVRGVGINASGEIQRYTEAHYRGDRFSFALATGEPGDVQLQIKP